MYFCFASLGSKLDCIVSAIFNSMGSRQVGSMFSEHIAVRYCMAVTDGNLDLRLSTAQKVLAI